MSGDAYGWDIDKAGAKAKEAGEAVALTRPDGTNSGLVVDATGQLRRQHLKPQGKAARKEFKALRRQLRELGPNAPGSVVRILKRRAFNLCKPAEHVIAPRPTPAAEPASDPFPDKQQRAAYTELFLKGNADARGGLPFENPYKGGDRHLDSAYWAGWNSGGGKAQQTEVVS